MDQKFLTMELFIETLEYLLKNSNYDSSISKIRLNIQDIEEFNNIINDFISETQIYEPLTSELLNELSVDYMSSDIKPSMKSQIL
jgi:hypothetical protein